MHAIYRLEYGHWSVILFTRKKHHMLRTINDEDDQRSSLNWLIRKSYDYNIDWIKKNVPDKLTQLIIIEKYKHASRNSVSGSALHHDMIQKVLPTVSDFIEKRFQFLPQKRDSLLDIMKSFTEVLLERANMFETKPKDDDDVNDP